MLKRLNKFHTCLSKKCRNSLVMIEGDKTIPNCLRITKKCFAVVIYFLSNCKLILPKFQGFSGILNYVLCFSSALLYQLSFEDPIYRRIIANLKIKV